MTTMNVSLPDSLKAYVDDQVARRRYGSASEFLRELIRRDQDRQHLRELILAGASSDAGPTATPEYFESLRERVNASDG